MIFDKGIMKTFIGFTSEFVQDSELCEDAVKILFVMFNSLRFHSQTERFFHEIGEFKSAVAILSANSKSEAVCTNVLKLISGLLGDRISLKVSQKDLAKMLIESGGVEVINTVLREQKESRGVVKLCIQLLRVLPPDEGKSASLPFAIVILSHFFLNEPRCKGKT